MESRRCSRSIFNVRGREWTNKDGNVLYFTTLNGWKVREYQEVTAQDQAPDREDDLPF